MRHEKTVIKEGFKVGGFDVVPVMIWNMWQNSHFYRYLVYFDSKSLGYVSEYNKLTSNYFLECFNNKEYTLKNHSNLSMLKYN